MRAVSTVVLQVGECAVKVHPPGTDPLHLARVHAVLADSPVVAFTAAGPDVVYDDRLERLRKAGALRTRAAVDRLRNSEDGFWVAEAGPEAASRALRRHWPRAEVEAAAVLALVDGQQRTVLAALDVSGHQSSLPPGATLVDVGGLGLWAFDPPEADR